MSVNPCYDEYLKSEAWLAKRDRLLRATPRCKRCIMRRATQIHHLTYERMYREIDSDLLPICRPCHECIEGLRKLDSRILWMMRTFGDKWAARLRTIEECDLLPNNRGDHRNVPWFSGEMRFGDAFFNSVDAEFRPREKCSSKNVLVYQWIIPNDDIAVDGLGWIRRLDDGCYIVGIGLFFPHSGIKKKNLLLPNADEEVLDMWDRGITPYSKELIKKHNEPEASKSTATAKGA